MDASMDKAIAEANKCAKICSDTKAKCVDMGGEHAEPMHLNLLEDCAKICELSADFMTRESGFHMDVCDTCANICEATAESCNEFDDKFMQDCAKQCIMCADECRKMIDEMGDDADDDVEEDE